MISMSKTFDINGFRTIVHFPNEILVPSLINLEFMTKVESSLRTFYNFGATTKLILTITENGTIDVDYMAGDDGAIGGYYFFETVNDELIYDFANEYSSTATLGSELNMQSECKELFFEIAYKIFVDSPINTVMWEAMETTNLDKFVEDFKDRFGEEALSQVYEKYQNEKLLPPSVKDIFLF